MQATLTKDAVLTTFSFGNMDHTEMFKAAGIIQKATMARPNGYEWMPKFKSGRWDGYIRLVTGNEFPTGLCNRVIYVLMIAGYSVSIKNRFRDVPVDWDVIQPDMFDGLMLRDYQLDATRRLLAFERGVAKMATNSGKTVVIAAIAKAVSEPILILVTKVDLMYQTAEVLAGHLGEPVGLIGDGQFQLERVTVGMIQTLVKRLEFFKDEVWEKSVYEPPINWLDRIGCVMFDECHHLPSKTSQAVMYAIPAPLRFGFSGTPLSYDDLADLVLMGATGDVVVEVSNQDLIEAGISATPTIHTYELWDADEEHEESDYQTAYDWYIVTDPTRNEIIAEEVKVRQAASTLVLVSRIKHGDTLHELLPGSIWVNGRHDIETRKQVLDRLRDGDGAVVISTNIFEEGIDVPAVDLLVMAGGGKGHRKLLQSIGRGIRAKPGANTLTVIDFYDDTNKHLRAHSAARLDIYRGEGFKVVEE